jgi:hypothetical protein
MKLFKIELINKLDGIKTVHQWREHKNEDYCVFMWENGYMQCDCNRSMFRYGYHECFPCNTSEHDRIFFVKIFDEENKIIYEENMAL